MSNYRIEYLDGGDFNRWDRFVERSPTGTIFHTSYWLEAVAERLEICTVMKGEELVGGLPLTPTSKYGIDILGHPSLTPYSGIVFADMSERKRVSVVSERKSVGEEIAAELKTRFDRVHIYTSPRLHPNLMPFKWEEYTFNLKHTYLLDLSDPEAIWTEMDGNRRNDIRKAEDDGVTVQRTREIDDVLALVEKTFERQGEVFAGVTAARRVHEEVSKRDQAMAHVARDADGVPIAASYVVWDNLQAYYLLGGYDSKHGHHGATALALWDAIKHTIEEVGLSVFDFEGSEITRIERFFRKFGGEVCPYYGLIWTTRWLRPITILRSQ